MSVTNHHQSLSANRATRRAKARGQTLADKRVASRLHVAMFSRFMEYEGLGLALFTGIDIDEECLPKVERAAARAKAKSCVWEFDLDDDCTPF